MISPPFIEIVTMSLMANFIVRVGTTAVLRGQADARASLTGCKAPLSGIAQATIGGEIFRVTGCFIIRVSLLIAVCRHFPD